MLERKLISLKVYAGKAVGKMVALEYTRQLINRRIISLGFASHLCDVTVLEDIIALW